MEGEEWALKGLGTLDPFESPAQRFMKKHMEMVEGRDDSELWEEYRGGCVIAKWLRKDYRFHVISLRCRNLVEAERWHKRLRRQVKKG